MSRSTRPSRRRAAAGFTLIEVVVALAVLAVSLTAIGSLMASTIRGARSFDQRLALVETGRSIMTGLPNRSQLAVGNFSGEAAGHRWRVDVAPYLAGAVDARTPPLWIPQAVAIRVQSPSGAVLQLNTIKLRRRTGE